MTISLNLKNGAVAQNVSEDQNYSYIYHEYNDLKSELRVGVDSNGSYTNVISDKIYHNGNNITPYNYITNCITSISEDIKLELNDGTLTLKASSKVYVPNGFEADGTTPKFDVIVIESDKTNLDTSKTGQYLLCMTLSGQLGWGNLSTSISGAGVTPPSTYAVAYDTTANTIKRYDDTTSLYSLPLAVCTMGSTGVVSIDQVFNGYGYIGSTMFALPGVKGLIPNNRNKDRTLNSIEFITSKVMTTNLTFTDTQDIRLNDDAITSGDLIYDPIKNRNTPENLDELRRSISIGKATAISGKITSFKPKTVFHAVDYNDFKNIKGLLRYDLANPITVNRGDTLTKSGMLYCSAAGLNYGVTVRVNGYDIWHASNSESGNYATTDNRSMSLVFAGDVVSANVVNASTFRMVLYPFIGE